MMNITTLEHSILAAPVGVAPVSLADVLVILRSKRFVDLTHPFAPGIAHWKGFGDEDRRVEYDYDQMGFRTHRYSFVGQWGTHVDPPAHFIPGLRALDQIDVREMILPLAVLDIHRQVAANPDYAVTMADVRYWEARHGHIPPGAFVALRTDWSKRWPDMEAMYNRDSDGIDHFPGWSQEVLTNLDQTSESGGLIIVSFPKPSGGTGFPARAFAIVP